MGGQAHLRLEHRIIPAGPSLVDVVANIAFFLGLVEYLRTQRPCPESKISFTRAKKNFYLAAQKGLDAKITWLDGKTYKLQDLILKKLISTACDGLKLLGIHQADIDFYIKKIIRQRVETGQNGAAWQRAFVVRNGLDWTALTRAYASHQKDGHPVHEWKI
jgi:gamma-glutamyl:cysteine ligase YbdK (ATP-grasp superfamily)